jgi:hypothetical protein
MSLGAKALSAFDVAASATHQCLPVVLLEGRRYCPSLKGIMDRMITIVL